MNSNQKKLQLAVSTGEALLKYGGEIYRVEDTVSHILEAYDITDYNVYVISNGIFATVEETGEHPCHVVRHVPLGGVNLDKICAINQLSREICSGSCTIDDAFRKLKQCIDIPEVPKRTQIIACAMGSAAFCYLFGGSFFDSVVSFFLGATLQIFLFQLSARNSRFIPNILGSLLVTFLSLLLLHLSLPIQQDKVVIGAIIPLVPGVAFTTSIRDFFNGDYLSGAIHMIDALLTALCIAIGVGAAVSLYKILTGGFLL